MKRIFIFFISFICLALPVWADEIKPPNKFINGLKKILEIPPSYKYQNADEKKFLSKIKEEINILLLYHPHYLCKDDYQGYLNNKDTMYGSIINKSQEIKDDNKSADNNEQNQINIYVLNLVAETIEKVANDKNSAGVRISISDDIYPYLYDDVKYSVNIVNLILKLNKDELLPYIESYYSNRIDEYQKKAQNNKNNMKELYKLYEKIEEEEQNLKTAFDSYSYPYMEAENTRKLAGDLYTKFNSLSYNIYKQGENYERQKFLGWAKKNNKKLVDGRLSNYVYYSHAPVPKLGYLYKHVPAGDFYLTVLQSVPGGVILTGEYLGPYGPTGYGSIFLQTSKQFADGQIIREGIVAEYKGYYDYYTVLGVKKRIYKFYRLGETEIKKNFEIPGQPFYFYYPY